MTGSGGNARRQERLTRNGGPTADNSAADARPRFLPKASLVTPTPAPQKSECLASSADRRWQKLNDRAFGHRISGEHELAWDCHRNALQLAEQHGLSRQATESRIEVAGTVIKLGLTAEASALLASALSDQDLGSALRRRVNELLSELFEFDGDWAEALSYWSHAGTYIEEDDQARRFWWHQQNCALLIKAGDLQGAEEQVHLADQLWPKDQVEAQDAWMGDLLLVRRAELAGAQGRTATALAWARQAHRNLTAGSVERLAQTATLIQVQLLLESGRYNELVNVVQTSEDSDLGHRALARLGRYHAEALKKLGRWQEASAQLEQLIRVEQRRDTNAHSVYLLQQEIETSEAVKRQNQELAKANQVLLDANEDRAHLMDIIRRDLQTQLLGTAAAWEKLRTASSPIERTALLQQAANSVDRLTATAGQVVEVRLLEAKELDLTREKLPLQQLLDEATSSISGGPVAINNITSDIEIATDPAHFVSAIRHILTAFSSDIDIEPPVSTRSITFGTVRDGKGDGFEAHIVGPNLARDVGTDFDFDLDLGSTHQEYPANFDRGLINLYLGRELLGYLEFEVSVTRERDDSMIVRALGTSSQIKL